MRLQVLISAVASLGMSLVVGATPSRAPMALGGPPLATIPADAGAGAARRLLRAGLDRPDSPGRVALSSNDYFDFSGIGAIVCTAGTVRWTSTAFFVGDFDIMVTSADAFRKHGLRAAAQDCVYTNTDSSGRIREAIPLAYFKSQWDLDDGADGDRGRDLAVVKLKEPSAYAQKTLALAKFDGRPTRAFIVGFPADIEADTLKTKSLGTVYAGGIMLDHRAALYFHDISVRGIAAGAPIISAATGAIIGLYPDASASSSPARSTPIAVHDLVVMNSWLETTLRAELKKNKANAPHGDSMPAPAAAASTGTATGN